MFGEPLRDGFRGAGPVAGLACAEQEAETEEAAKAASERREDRGERIPEDGDGEAAFGADAVHQAAADGLADGVGDAEGDDNVGVVGVGPVVFAFEERGEEREGLAVDVVDDGGGEKQSDDPPAQRGDGARRAACGIHALGWSRSASGVGFVAIGKLRESFGREARGGIAIEIDCGV